MFQGGIMNTYRIAIFLFMAIFSNFASMEIVLVENMDHPLDASSNGRPVVIIIGERIKNQKVLRRYPYAKGRSYIAASYVKFMESAGARVMPLSDATNISEVEYLFHNTNGVLLPGGGENLISSGYERLAKRFFELIKESSQVGDDYPLIGICLGMEQEVVLIAEKNILQGTDSENIGRSMNFTKAASKSKFFGTMPDEVRATLTLTTAAFNNHKFSLLPGAFLKNEHLSSFYDILSTSKDRNGRTFIASIEAKDYPIFGFQWHPEKNMFEWKPSLNIERSEQAIAASQFIANRFMHFVKQNKHELPPSLEDRLIYRHQPVYTGDISSFEQIYII